MSLKQTLQTYLQIRPSRSPKPRSNLSLARKDSETHLVVQERDCESIIEEEGGKGI